LEDATLEAPIGGVVIFNAPGGITAKATEGSAVSPQAAPFTVVDMDALKFTAEVDEADIDRVRKGMKASITLDAFPGEEFPTTVTRINPAAQATATGGTIFAVELDLSGTDKHILLGMKGDTDVEVSSRGAAITIPVEALFSEGGTDFVYSVVAGKLKKTEIEVGATTDTEVEVLSGLTAGDVVALSGSTQYADGMSVRTK
jgi:HlyD family secretion protein